MFILKWNKMEEMAFTLSVLCGQYRFVFSEGNLQCLQSRNVVLYISFIFVLDLQ